jgi:putative DNA primase/helicase
MPNQRTKNNHTMQRTSTQAGSPTNLVSTNRLIDKHYAECVTKRGLHPDWIAVNCRSMTVKEASERLGYPAKSAGIWLESVNGFGQYRPDNPWGKNKPKYRTATVEEFDAMLPRHPDNPDYWIDLEALKKLCYSINGHPLLVITEGLFKAIAGCANDIPTVALVGVEMGLTSGDSDVQGKRYLVETLEKLARAGFGFIVLFDADAATNDNVVQAQRKLSAQLSKFNVPVYIGTGLWNVDQGKGMDDYIKANGADQFKREVMGKVIDLATWEQQFKSDQEQLAKKLTPRQTAKQIVDEYRTKWKYHLEQNTWRYCKHEKVWTPVRDETFIQNVYSRLETLGTDYGSSAFVEDVAKFLKMELLENEWKTFDRKKWIAFKDCVYEVETGKKHKHCPGFGFFTALEHDYPKLAIDPKLSLLEQLKQHAPTFYDWAMYSQKQDPIKVLKLLAIINGVIKFRFHELQMFVYLQGVPKSGKSSFGRLLQLIVGDSNSYSTRITKLNDDYSIANFINSQLVICPDERKQVGEWSGLLSLTGGDTLSYRQIYKPASNGKFYGTLVVVSNPSVFAGETAGIDRRLCLVTFDVPLKNQDPKVEKQMQQELPALMALALAMGDEQVTELINGTGASAVPDFQRAAWLNKTENDSVALFMEEMLVAASPEHYTLLGNKSSGADTLYSAYVKLCEDNNSKNLFTTNNFKNHLLDLCRDIGWNEAREARQRDHQYRIYGLRLRQTEDNASSISEILGTARCAGVCIGCADSVRTLEPLENMECAGCANKNAPIIAGENENFTLDGEEKFSKKVNDPPKTPHTTHTLDIAEFQTRTHPAHTPHTPAHTTQEFHAGDPVEYVGDNANLKRKKLTVSFVNADGVWLKKGDGLSAGCVQASELRRR